jgi:WAS family protein 1
VITSSTENVNVREEMQRNRAENYFYIPDIGNVPDIAVPDFLPNLLGNTLKLVFRELA